MAYDFDIVHAENCHSNKPTKPLRADPAACPVAAVRADEIGLTRLWQAGWENGDCLGIWSLPPWMRIGDIDEKLT